MLSLLGKVTSPLLQSINASCVYKNGSFIYINASCNFINKSCVYRLPYNLNKFTSHAKEVCIGRKETFLYILEGKDKEV